MTLDDRVHALASLGLTPRQTRFVALVALHSGYCLRRQYLTFAGLQYGKNVRSFSTAWWPAASPGGLRTAATVATSITSVRGPSIVRSTKRRIAIDAIQVRR